ncbi:putative G2-specific protein kinase nimA [Blattamonas nauphoetae]|uniref:non-specific serine/threonine protein kinase n=1 Tax=Blattamonas nauphoetae TaxID=2049346 RepID=A0ABQ9XZB8_9EUKA|nr:putative G2-specific protein kinase nimA [Blattamonas nauphoetae]
MGHCCSMPLKDFQKVKLLGKGSYGSVWDVVRKVDGQHYALKEINLRFMNAKEQEESLNEIRILASFRHPNITKYKEAFMEDDKLFIITELVEGGDLLMLIRKRKTARRYLSEEQIWSYFIQICLGLHYLHQKNVLHRDIKSANVFLTHDGVAKIGDLGVAKVLKSAETLAQTAIGTPYYLCPEMWSNRPYNTKSDVWSLGCVLYEMITLNRPFDAPTMQALRQRVSSGRVAPLPSCFSPDLSALVSSILVVDPARRPTVQQILAQPRVVQHFKTLPTVDYSEDRQPKPRAALPQSQGAFFPNGSPKFNLAVPLRMPRLKSQRKEIVLPPAKYGETQRLAESVREQITDERMKREEEMRSVRSEFDGRQRETDRREEERRRRRQEEENIPAISYDRNGRRITRQKGDQRKGPEEVRQPERRRVGDVAERERVERRREEERREELLRREEEDRKRNENQKKPTRKGEQDEDEKNYADDDFDSTAEEERILQSEINKQERLARRVARGEQNRAQQQQPFLAPPQRQSPIPLYSNQQNSIAQRKYGHTPLFSNPNPINPNQRGLPDGQVSRLPPLVAQYSDQQQYSHPYGAQAKGIGRGQKGEEEQRSLVPPVKQGAVGVQRYSTRFETEYRSNYAQQKWGKGYG